MATVTELINAADARANAATATVSAFLAALQAAINVQFDTGLPTTYNYASVPHVNYPILVDGIRPEVNLDSAGAPPAAPVIEISAVQEIAVPSDDLVAPTHEFTFFEQAYSSTLLDPLKAKLLEDLTNGGYGIDPDDEGALFQRMRDRETEAALMRVEEAGRTMAARGFPLPPGELSIQIDRAYQEMQGKLSSASREIFLDRSKRFVENRQFTIQQVKELEQILIGFHNSVQERALNVARATAEFAIALFNAQVARLRTLLEKAKISADVQAQKIQAEAARAQALLAVFQGQIAVYEADLRRLIESARIGADLYRTDIEATKALTEATSVRTALQQKVLEATVQQNTDISRVAVANAQARVQAEIAAAQLALEAAKGGATTSASVLLGILNAVNTLAVQTAGDA